MFGLNKYIDKLYDIEWRFPPTDKQDLEALLFVEFEQTPQKTYKITNVKYTYVDILLGLEELNFKLEKTNDKYIIQLYP